MQWRLCDGPSVVVTNKGIYLELWIGHEAVRLEILLTVWSQDPTGPPHGSPNDLEFTEPAL
jgi:hypothetical protein